MAPYYICRRKWCAVQGRVASRSAVETLMKRSAHCSSRPWHQQRSRSPSPCTMRSLVAFSKPTSYVPHSSNGRATMQSSPDGDTLSLTRIIVSLQIRLRRIGTRVAPLDSLQQEHERQRKADQGLLSEEARSRILALSADFPRVWNDERTAPLERKRMVALLIEDITLLRTEASRSTYASAADGDVTDVPQTRSQWRSFARRSPR